MKEQISKIEIMVVSLILASFLVITFKTISEKNETVQFMREMSFFDVLATDEKKFLLDVEKKSINGKIDDAKTATLHMSNGEIHQILVDEKNNTFYVESECPVKGKMFSYNNEARAKILNRDIDEKTIGEKEVIVLKK